MDRYPKTVLAIATASLVVSWAVCGVSSLTYCAAVPPRARGRETGRTDVQELMGGMFFPVAAAALVYPCVILGQRRRRRLVGTVVGKALAVFAAVWPVAVILYSLAVYFALGMFCLFWPGYISEGSPAMESFILMVAVVASWTTLSLLIIYLLLVLRNRRLGKTAGILWIASIVLFSAIAMPLYWHLHVWREPES